MYLLIQVSILNFIVREWFNFILLKFQAVYNSQWKRQPSFNLLVVSSHETSWWNSFKELYIMRKWWEPCSSASRLLTEKKTINFIVKLYGWGNFSHGTVLVWPCSRIVIGAYTRVNSDSTLTKAEPSAHSLLIIASVLICSLVITFARTVDCTSMFDTCIPVYLVIWYHN